MRRILTTNPRSGTHYLKSLISAAFRTAPFEKDLSEPGDLLAAGSSVPTNQLIYGHFCFSRHGEVLSERTFPGLRILVLTRHPFDRLISQLAFEKALCGVLPDPNATPQELARELLLGQWDGKPWANGKVVDDFAAWHNFVMHDLVTAWLEHRSCHLVKFENLIADPLGVLQACLEFFHIALPRSEVIEIVKRINFQSLSGGRLPGQIDPASHYRAGVPGEWRRVFTDADIELLKPKFELELRRAGYSLECADLPRLPVSELSTASSGEVVARTLRSGTDSPPVRTLIPGQKAIQLVAYYLHQVDYYPECELQTKRWFVENVQPDWVMFDVGANIGYYSILFSRLAPAGQIYAFEPTATFSMLEENLAYNACRNVKPMRIAVGIASGAVEDNVFRIWGNDPERQIYNFSTVDDLVERLKLTRLDCVKIDVDSFDFEVLMGAEQTLKRFNPWVVVELCHALSMRNQSVQEALEWLTIKGYRKSHVLDHTSFVLHRDPETLSDGRTDEPGIRLTFENRPIILPPSWVKAAPIENLFAGEAQAHNNAKIGRDSCKRLLLCVPGPRWAYACSWLCREDAKFERPFVVECRLQVSGGAVGLGCVVDDMTGYATKEVDIAPRDEPQTVCIYVENQAAAKHLVLRNIDLAGREAQVTILQLACFAAGTSA